MAKTVRVTMTDGLYDLLARAAAAYTYDDRKHRPKSKRWTVSDVIISELEDNESTFQERIEEWGNKETA